MIWDENLLDTVVPAAHGRLSENVKTAFTTLSDAMTALCSIYDTDNWQLTGTAEMETGDSLLEKGDLVLIDPLYNVWSNAEKLESEHDLYNQENIRDLVELCLKVLAPGAHGHLFCAWF